MKALAFLPATLLGALWWARAWVIVPSQAPLLTSQVITLVVIASIQGLSLVTCIAWSLRRNWELAIALGVLLLLGNALFFFTPAAGLPFMLLAMAVVAIDAVRAWLARGRVGPTTG